MSLIRLVLMLLILAGITLFALQNWVPVLPLVILGTPTQALPLAVWMVAALVAGALTTLVLASLFKVSNTVAVARRSPRRSVSSAADPLFTPPPDSQMPPRSPSVQTAAGFAAAASDDDWEQGSRRREEWDDWEDYVEPIDAPPMSTTGSRTVIQDEPTPKSQEREDWEWEEGQAPADDAAQSRNVYEVPQQPQTRYQSGSVYSYSYRDANSPQSGAADRANRTDSIYDADFRVIVPPYQPEAQSSSPLNDDEDWGFEDDDDFDANDRRKRSANDW